MASYVANNKTLGDIREGMNYIYLDEGMKGLYYIHFDEECMSERYPTHSFIPSYT